MKNALLTTIIVFICLLKSFSQACSGGYTIVGDRTLCIGQTKTYSISGSDIAQIVWNPPTDITSWSSAQQGASSIQLQGISAGTNKLYARVTDVCGNVSNLNVDLTVAEFGISGYYTNGYDAPRAIQDQNGITLQQNSPTATVVLNSSWGSQTSYSWTVTNQSPSGTYWYYNNNDHSSVNIHCDGGKNLSIVCTVTTPCGTKQISFNCYNTSSYRVAASLAPEQGLDSDQLLVYPNPTKGKATVRFRLDDKQEATLSIVNLLGIPVHQRKVVGTGNEQVEEVELMQKESGMYLIQLQNMQGRKVGRLLVEP